MRRLAGLSSTTSTLRPSSSCIGLFEDALQPVFGDDDAGVADTGAQTDFPVVAPLLFDIDNDFSLAGEFDRVADTG